MTTRLTIAVNPVFADRPVERLQPTCHDGTPFITFHCPICGQDSHTHESQIALAPAGSMLDMRCPGCEEDLLIATDEVRDAFAEMRAEGWIA